MRCFRLRAAARQALAAPSDRACDDKLALVPYIGAAVIDDFDCALQQLQVEVTQAPAPSAALEDSTRSGISVNHLKRKFTTCVELFQPSTSRRSSDASSSSCNALGTKDQEALQLALSVDPTTPTEKRVLKKAIQGTGKCCKKPAAAVGKSPSKPTSEKKPKGKGLSKKKGQSTVNEETDVEEKHRLRKNYASRKYHKAVVC